MRNQLIKYSRELLIAEIHRRRHHQLFRTFQAKWCAYFEFRNAATQKRFRSATLLYLRLRARALPMSYVVEHFCDTQYTSLHVFTILLVPFPPIRLYNQNLLLLIHARSFLIVIYLVQCPMVAYSILLRQSELPTHTSCPWL